MRRDKKSAYFGKEKAAKDAPRLTSTWAINNRGGFSFDGHRLSSLYRAVTFGLAWLRRRYDSAYSLPKYSESTSAGVTAPGMDASQ
jgi:hypothetical protein